MPCRTDASCASACSSCRGRLPVHLGSTEFGALSVFAFGGRKFFQTVSSSSLTCSTLQL